MGLFQKSVLSNQLKSISDNEIDKGWRKFQDYKSIASKIQNYKEEEFQFDFLKMLFDDCLGYKISDVGEEMAWISGGLRVHLNSNRNLFERYGF
jgi:hypothetical protein